MRNESLSTTSMLVREFDSRNMHEVSVREWQEAEQKAGSSSAFAETRAVLSNGYVARTEMKADQYLDYRNK